MSQTKIKSYNDAQLLGCSYVGAIQNLQHTHSELIKRKMHVDVQE